MINTAFINMCSKINRTQIAYGNFTVRGVEGMLAELRVGSNLVGREASRDTWPNTPNSASNSSRLDWFAQGVLVYAHLVAFASSKHVRLLACPSSAILYQFAHDML